MFGAVGVAKGRWASGTFADCRRGCVGIVKGLRSLACRILRGKGWEQHVQQVLRVYLRKSSKQIPEMKAQQAWFWT